MSENRPPRNADDSGAIPDDVSLETSSTALKKIPLHTTVTKEFDYFTDFVAEFGQHVYPQGMFVPSPRPKPKGSRLKLDFKTRDGFQILDAICEVVRCDEALPGTLSGMWVAFTNLSEASKELTARIASQREVSIPREKPPEVSSASKAPSAPPTPVGAPRADRRGGDEG